jgi:group II intron reverse transcriptase/maturase
MVTPPERAANLVELIRERRYKPNPVRRVEIPKKTPGKTRPLGMPSADDKQVQEVVRMILERIYEPLFKDSSHGFRPKRSCHTALKSIKDGWTGTKWFIELDIKGFFDNINHDILMELLKKRIEDTQFLDLIRDMLKAGYVENWQYHKTYSGTPQGGIISPILANIYLHELDEFMEQKRQDFYSGKKRKKEKEWVQTCKRLYYARSRIKEARRENNHKVEEEWMQKIREFSNQQKSLPASDPLDPNYRRLFYVRYADDYLIGIIGSKKEAEQVFREVQLYLNTTLKLAIAEEKSGIHHAKDGTAFLGYEVINRTTEKILKVRRRDTKVVAATRTVKDRINLRIPEHKMREFCQSKGYGNFDTLKPSNRTHWLHLDDEEILLSYNAEMRGIANYYALANNAKRGLQKAIFLAESSFLATLANKHNSSIEKEATRLRQGRDLCITIQTKGGKRRRYTLFKLRDWRPPQSKEDIDALPHIGRVLQGRSSVAQRLLANICEFCGKEEGYFEVHHVRKLKDVVGKEAWEKVMIARKRKTIVLCIECHDLLHAGKLSNRQKKV